MMMNPNGHNHQPPPTERRRSERITDYRALWWRGDGNRIPRCGFLITFSQHGLSMLTRKADTPALGSRIVPTKNATHPLSNRAALVRRIESRSPTLDLIVAELKAA